MPAKRMPPKNKPAKKLTKKRGRPSKFTEATAMKILRGLANGVPLSLICSPANMPGITTVWDWQQRHPSFSESIARAREAGWDAIALECRTIADTPMEGVERTDTPEGPRIKRGDMLGHRRLQVETRLKLLAKWDPKRYGERMATEISGPDGGPLENVLSITPDIEERIKRLAVIRSSMKPPFGYADPG